MPDRTSVPVGTIMPLDTSTPPVVPVVCSGGIKPAVKVARGSPEEVESAKTMDVPKIGPGPGFGRNMPLTVAVARTGVDGAAVPPVAASGIGMTIFVTSGRLDGIMAVVRPNSEPKEFKSDKMPESAPEASGGSCMGTVSWAGNVTGGSETSESIADTISETIGPMTGTSISSPAVEVAVAVPVVTGSCVF